MLGELRVEMVAFMLTKSTQIRVKYPFIQKPEEFWEYFTIVFFYCRLGKK